MKKILLAVMIISISLFVFSNSDNSLNIDVNVEVQSHVTLTTNDPVMGDNQTDWSTYEDYDRWLTNNDWGFNQSNYPVIQPNVYNQYYFLFNRTPISINSNNAVSVKTWFEVNPEAVNPDFYNDGQDYPDYESWGIDVIDPTSQDAFTTGVQTGLAAFVAMYRPAGSLLNSNKTGPFLGGYLPVFQNPDVLGTTEPESPLAYSSSNGVINLYYDVVVKLDQDNRFALQAGENITLGWINVIVAAED
ncbi:hypothetical protein [Oceanotoga teriensis]|uniref:hypothetical protein n=1 Tax=Oceanotoga teriensis TaxID=515440 RepID=UPI002713A489|nr:hypothetical protein [Oceanotoga teriensis]MDO7976604.1 hypothetical protein [Oceanotoga teriensis]